MYPALLLACVVPLLGGMPPPPGLPPADPLGPTLAALDDGRWAEAQPAAKLAWETHRAWVGGWMAKYDALRLEACAAIDVARAEVEAAERAEAEAVAEWDGWMADLDDPQPEGRLGYRRARRPKLIPGPGTACLVDRLTTLRAFIDRRDHAAEARVRAQITAALGGQGPAPPAACAFAWQWAVGAHQMYLAAGAGLYHDPTTEAAERAPTAASRQAATTYAHLLRACPDVTADGEVIFYFAELKSRLGDPAGARALYDRYVESWPRGRWRADAVVGGVRTCREIAAAGPDPEAAAKACERGLERLHPQIDRPGWHPPGHR